MFYNDLFIYLFFFFIFIFFLFLFLFLFFFFLPPDFVTGVQQYTFSGHFFHSFDGPNCSFDMKTIFHFCEQAYQNPFKTTGRKLSAALYQMCTCTI